MFSISSIMQAHRDEAVAAAAAVATPASSTLREDLVSANGAQRDAVAAQDLSTSGPVSYTLSNTKWGPSGTMGTSGGVVTWSIAGAGEANASGYASWFSGTTLSMSSVFTFDYVAILTQAFAAWSAVANISFQYVADGGGAMGSGMTGNIRIGTASMDGVSNTLGSAFLPQTAGNAGDYALSGDLIFDSGEGSFWTQSSLLAVATHEIGHALGLDHTYVGNSLMEPYYNPAITTPQADDIAGIQAIYGAVVTGDGAFSVSDASITEGNSGTKVMTFTVMRTGSAANAATVDYATAGSSAVAGADFVATAGALTFGVGVTSQVVSVIINGDTTSEPNETFNLVLSNAQGGTTIADGTGVGTITNDDAVPADDYADSRTDLSSPMGTLSVNGQATGWIETADDMDWFRISLTAGVTYYFDMMGADSGSGTLADPLLGLYNSSGTLLSVDDQSGYGNNAFITYTVQTSGFYYLGCIGYSPTETGTYTLYAQPSTIFTAGDDTVTLIVPFATWNAQAGNDVVNGTSGSDTINGGDGNDILFGLAGADSLVGGIGDDQLLAGDGLDTLAGGAGNDVYTVDSTNDIIIENSLEGFDTVYSSANYTLAANVEQLVLTPGAGTGYGNTADNVLNSTLLSLGSSLYGYEGNDIFYGSNHADAIYGGTGNDVILGYYSALGQDSLYGEAGDDVYYLVEADNIVETAGNGLDTVYTQANLTLAANVEQAVVYGAATQVTGNSDNNNLFGNNAAAAVTLDGGAGDDWIIGSGFSDSLIGNTGNDVIQALGGNNTLAGGTGNDVYYSTSSGDVIIEASASGFDTLYINYSLPSLAVYVEQAIIWGGASVLNGNSQDNNLFGNNNTTAMSIYGLGGKDWIIGGAQSDQIYGGDGNDVMQGLGGNNTMNGGNNDDVYYSTSSGDVIQEASGGGFDTLYANYSVAGLASEVEQLVVYGGATSAYGNSGSNVLYGNNSANGLGLYGQGGADVIYGSNYVDSIFGGAGNDTMRGLGGADIFGYVAGDIGADIISDFTDGSDVIRLTGCGYTAGSIGSAITIGGGTNALITFSSGTLAGSTITLLGLNQSLITSADFQF